MIKTFQIRIGDVALTDNGQTRSSNSLCGRISKTRPWANEPFFQNCFLMGLPRPLFHFIFIFSVTTVLTDIEILVKMLPMVGIKPWSSRVESDHSASWATTTSLNFVLNVLFTILLCYLLLIIFKWRTCETAIVENFHGEGVIFWNDGSRT